MTDPNLSVGSTHTLKSEVIRMGILDSLSGRQQAVSTEDVAAELTPFLVEGERVERAFRVFRDLLVFTNRRLISIDRQGVTGKKVDYRSVPYVNITMFSKESAGMLDLDAELKLWIRGFPEPLQFSFNKDAPINDVYKVLSDHILK
jgi:Bacterial PH domain